MSGQFGPNSTTDEVLEGHDLKGKRVLVTGVSAGIGVETARTLVAHGAHVVGTVRDMAKGEKATAGIRAAAGAGQLELVQMDLSSLASVRACADALVKKGLPFDVVIANAGVTAHQLIRTEDGFEMQFGTNHLGHFVLINRIAPLLTRGSRVVMLSSASHLHANVDLDDPNYDRRPFNHGAYAQSKTANAQFAVEFDRRHRDRGVRAVAVHPGIIFTELMRETGPEPMQAWINHTNPQRVAAGKPPIHVKSIPQGAATSVWAGFVASADEVGGKYCDNCQVVSRVVVGEASEPDGGMRSYLLDPKAAGELWTVSEGLVKERFSPA